jgi:hypothetical protein
MGQPKSKLLAELGVLEIRQVRRTPAEALFGRLLQTYHYLWYRRPVGEQVKYLVYGRGQPIGTLVPPKQSGTGTSGTIRGVFDHGLGFSRGQGTVVQTTERA